MRKIVELQLGRIERRVHDNYRAQIRFDPQLVTHIVERCREVETGARTVDHIISRTLLPELSGRFLSRLAEAEPIHEVFVSLEEDGSFGYRIS
jgi:type VI secretion system protein VasG